MAEAPPPPELMAPHSPPHREGQSPASGPLHAPLSIPGTFFPFTPLDSALNATLSERLPYNTTVHTTQPCLALSPSIASLYVTFLQSTFTTGLGAV